MIVACLLVACTKKRLKNFLRINEWEVHLGISFNSFHETFKNSASNIGLRLVSEKQSCDIPAAFPNSEGF